MARCAEEFPLVGFPLSFLLRSFLDPVQRSGKFTIVANVVRMHTGGQFTDGNRNKMAFIAGDLFA